MVSHESFIVVRIALNPIAIHEKRPQKEGDAGSCHSEIHKFTFPYHIDFVRHLFASTYPSGKT
jgi:hypothetical protein